MDNAEEQNTLSTVSKYTALVNMITTMEGRLWISELVYLCLSIAILFFTVTLISSLSASGPLSLPLIRQTSIMLCLITGECVCIVWVISSMRLQLRLKLRYFQARSFERRLGIPGEFIYCEDHQFFDPQINRIESFDKREILIYPNEGTLRMDGVVGSAKPRHLSWMLPAVFFFINFFLLVWVLMGIVSAA